jgi:hypothetical protein
MDLMGKSVRDTLSFSSCSVIGYMLLTGLKTFNVNLDFVIKVVFVIFRLFTYCLPHIILYYLEGSHYM